MNSNIAILGILMCHGAIGIGVIFVEVTMAFLNITPGKVSVTPHTCMYIRIGRDVDPD